MSAVLKIIDKQLGQVANDSFKLHLASERLTARQLIERRVTHEVEQINQDLLKLRQAHGRVRSFLVGINPDTTEKRLNTPKPFTQRKALNESSEIEAAIKGFEANSFVMLFDDRQIEDLDRELTVTPDSEVVFLRMVPLAGG